MAALTSPAGAGRGRWWWAGAVVIVAALVVGVVVVWNIHRNGQRPKGTAPTGLTPAPVCQLGDVLASQTRTHNFLEFREWPRAADEYAADYDASCDWGQVAGADGIDSRSVGWRAKRYDGPEGVARARRAYDLYIQMPRMLAPYDVRAVERVGNAASYQTAVTPGGTAQVSLLVVAGNRIVTVRFEGRDQGFLRTEPTPFAEGERITELLAHDILGRQW